MRVLVTNDDGIAAPGLRALAAAVAAHADVVVAAPTVEYSGAGASLHAELLGGRLAVTPVSMSLSDVDAYAVPASPAYLVILATLGAFGPRPDVVLSGINRGANVSRALPHSGTFGAAQTAAIHGLPAMAVSLEVLPPAAADPATGGASVAEFFNALNDDTLLWSTAAGIAVDLLPHLSSLPSGVALNVNVPNVAVVKGVRTATLGPVGQVHLVLAETGPGYVRPVIERTRDQPPAGTDLALLADGYATVTALHAVREADVDVVHR